jgi:hypothetical protein
MHRLAAISLVAWAVCGPFAWADAYVEVKSEQVLINCGSGGYRSAAGITEVKPGCLVMASQSSSESGHGYILYPDCDVEVLPGRVYTVEDRKGQVSGPKSFRPICKVAAAPWYLVGFAAPLIAYCTSSECFDDEDRRPRPASP